MAPAWTSAGAEYGISQGRSAHLSTVRTGRQTGRAQPQMRAYDIAGLTTAGSQTDLTIDGPMGVPFEPAFSGMVRGTLIDTPRGRTPIEDLRPGDLIATVHSGPQPIQWIGSMLLFPDRTAHAGAPLIRICVDTFGMDRPTSDLIIGHGMRLLHHGAHLQDRFDTADVAIPAHALCDGYGVFPMHPSVPVRLYHIVLPMQEMLRANGVPVESYHPGPEIQQMLPPETLAQLLEYFPHANSVADFGPMAYPRLTGFETRELLGLA